MCEICKKYLECIQQGLGNVFMVVMMPLFKWRADFLSNWQTSMKGKGKQANMYRVS